jgi:hypothetical protein
MRTNPALVGIGLDRTTRGSRAAGRQGSLTRPYSAVFFRSPGRLRLPLTPLATEADLGLLLLKFRLFDRRAALSGAPCRRAHELAEERLGASGA